jgi:hypothetical protein
LGRHAGIFARLTVLRAPTKNWLRNRERLSVGTVVLFAALTIRANHGAA